MWPVRTASRGIILGALALGFGLGQASYAQAPARVEVERLAETVRLNIILPESEGGDLSAEAELAANLVIVARVSEPITAELASLRQDASGYVAMARLDRDGQTLRLALAQDLEPRVSVSHNVIALDLAPPGAPAQPDVISPYERQRIAQAQAEAAEAAARQAAAQQAAELPVLPVNVSVGETGEYTQINFDWPESVTYSLETQDNRSVLRFSRKGDIDLAPISISPPRFIDSINEVEDEDGLAIALNTAGNASVRVFSNQPRQVILTLVDERTSGTESVLEALAAYADSLEETQQDEAEAGPQAEALEQVETPPIYVEPERANPVPESGVVQVEARRTNNDLVLGFPWASLPGIAVFRRADALWIVFDAGAELDISELNAAGGLHVRETRAFSGSDFAALRITAPVSTQADVSGVGSTWSVILADAIDEPPLPVRLARDTGFNRPAAIRIGMDNARGVRRIPDPIVGDELLILTADGEKRGIITPRRFAETQILPSAHGVAFELYADDLELVRHAGGATLSRPDGLELSRTANPAISRSVDRPVTPGFLDLERWRGDQTFLEGLHRLQQAGLNLEPEPLMALARFNLGWELAPEAIGYLNQAIVENPALEPAPETAALRGVAEYMLGRYEDANASLNHSGLVNDPAVQPWRALLAVEQRDWPTARRRFEQGRNSVFFFDPVWRTRITAYHALAAQMTNDLGAVQPLLDEVKAGEDDPEAKAIAAFALAGLEAKSGDLDSALARYDALSHDEWRPIQARALLAKTILQSEQGLIDPDEAVETLESLRFQWRGDDTEVEAAAMLGRVYAEAGRYDEALRIMDTTQLRFPESPVANQLALEMNDLFRMLFLEGGSDRMDPLSAVALWREYQALTPAGPDGIRMVMNIVGKLVQLDLLDQAAQFLQYWIDEPTVTMTGQARAQIARDLAEIYLMDERPEMALRAIDSTRIARLPSQLVDQRRLLQARAYSMVGRTEHALELIANDDSQGAERLRAQIAWDGQLWGDAGRRIEAMLGSAWREESLTDAQANDVMRAIIGYALAGETGSMDRIEARFGSTMAQTPHAAAFSFVANEAINATDSRVATLVNQLAQVEPSETLLRGFNQTGEETG